MSEAAPVQLAPESGKPARWKRYLAKFRSALAWSARKLKAGWLWLWGSIPEYLPFYLLVVVCSYAVYEAWIPTHVISSFSMPSTNKLPFGGDTVANVLRDTLASIKSEIETPRSEEQFIKLAGPATAFIPQRFPNFQTPSRAAVEVKGLSHEAVISLARHVLRRESMISGDVALEGEQFVLLARGDHGVSWQSRQPYPPTRDGLKAACRDLAEQILETTDPISLGAVLMIEHQPERAVSAFQKAVALSSGSYESHMNLGTALAAADRHEEAERSFRNAVDLEPRSSEAWIGLGYARRDQRKCEPALDAFHHLLQLQPRNAGTYLALGNVYFEMGKYPESIENYQLAIAIDSGYVTAHYNLGLAYYRSGRHEDSIKAYEQAVRFGPNEFMAINNLGVVLMDNKRSDEALQRFHQALVLKRDFFMAQENRLGVLQQQGRLAQATADFQRAVDRNLNDPVVHYNLYLALQKNGQEKEAKAELDKARRLGPNIGAPIKEHPSGCVS